MSTLYQAGVAAYTAARRVFEDPSIAHNQTLYLNQQAMYNLMWSYYNNSMFERIVGAANAWNWNVFAGGWAAYKMNYNLYRNIRLIYNPTKRLVDFYAGQVYGGVLAKDSQKLPDGIPLAVPFSPDTDPAVIDAVAQFWKWSNWQARKSVQVRYGAALGSVLIEIEDDLEHGRVAANIVWPGFVIDLEQDTAGNVKKYVLQYLAQDETGGYQYRKEVDAEGFRYYRDGEPFDYGTGTSSPNPYGFVPAVWVKHIDTGGQHGAPAISGAFGKIDELNNLASHVHDQIHKIIGSPLVFWTSAKVSQLDAIAPRVDSAELSEPAGDQESVFYLKGPAGGKVESLAGNLSLADSVVYMDRLIGEIEQDHPELTFYKELRAMSQVTGPAASRLVGDVASRFSEVAASYDAANVRLFQMALAIGGFRANAGAWGRSLSAHQQKFLPFNLDSYERDELDMTIVPRALLVPTKSEIAQEQELMWRGVYYGGQVGVPPEFILREAGWTEDRISQLVAARAAHAATSPTPTPQPSPPTPPGATPPPAAGPPLPPGATRA